MLARANPPRRNHGDFEIKGRPGGGGSGTAGTPRDRMLRDRTGLPRTLNAELASDPDRAMRFPRQVSSRASLDQSATGPIHRSGEVDRVHSISPRCIEGMTRAHLARETGPVPVTEARTVR
ncbi:MAG: hypothetical protein EBT09_04255 [Actinobacteria bacterium]|nr:hypothetical protein [Actinomycetota bacterium]